ncbi:MAG: A/G-specific adenine glycosylase [Candidatus Eremiobacteraeota bacterium]|nr:A/G-specific adenine glycosylase [Candidatus Eremiobacteraeota bacterium]
MAVIKTSTNWSSFFNSLLSWYAENKRSLPWRKIKDPYSIWISEVMLQQTQVTSVIPYYERFLKEFPSLGTLAAAPLEKVLKTWEGLGYYSRARHLHDTAKEVREKYGGELPSHHKDLMKLPGIGDYTAGAVASIAFGEPVPVADGNVWRVFSRILLLEELPSAGKRKILKFLSKFIPKFDPSLFNQAVMELGALICAPENPSCRICPVKEFCRAFHEEKISEYPKKASKKEIPHKIWAVLGAVCQGKILLRKREEKGLWEGLWDLPSASIAKQSEAGEQFQNMVEKFYLEVLSKTISLPPIKHLLSHFKLTLYPFAVEVKNNPDVKGYSWIDYENNPHPIPVPYLKIIRMIKHKMQNMRQY